jgi:hypothetical protein
MTAGSVKCSAAPVWRDRHMASTDHQYHLTTPNGEQYVFCSGCCLLSYACHGALPADLVPNLHQASESEPAA